MISLNGTPHNSQKIHPTLIASTISLQTPDELQSRQANTLCEDCRLRSLCLSKTLDTDGLNKLDTVLRHPHPFRKGKHLFRQGDEFKSLFIIRSGATKSYRTSINGEEQGVSFFLPGEMLGLDGLHTKQYTNSVIALEDTLVCEYPFRELEKLLATLKDVQKLAGDCYQGASEREPILVIAQIWEAANETLAAVQTTKQGEK